MGVVVELKFRIEIKKEDCVLLYEEREIMLRNGVSRIPKGQTNKMQISLLFFRNKSHFLINEEKKRKKQNKNNFIFSPP